MTLRPLFTVLLLAFSLTAFTQNQVEPDARLLSKFSQTELKAMGAEEISYWNKYVDAATEIVVLPEFKVSGIQGSVALESGSVNIFELGVKPHSVARNYLRIEGSNNVLVIRSESEIEQLIGNLDDYRTESEFDRGGGALTISITDGGSTTLPCGTGPSFQHTFQDDNPSGSYAPNLSDTVTICPDGTNGSKVTLRMFPEVGDTWDVHGSDTLYVFDGPDANSPLLGAYNSDTDTNGISVQATFDNPSGCLTFVFVSNGSNEADGFSGLITCGYPCQPFEPIIASDPLMEPADTGYIDICFGDTVWLYGNANFPYSGTEGGIGYDQRLESSTFNWEFADGTIINDQDTVFFVPQVRAGYLVEMRVTDTLGCIDVQTTKIRVSTIPSFAGTVEYLEDTICLGAQTTLVGGVTFNDTAGVDPNQGAFINGGVFAGLTYLPDGSGVNYETDILIENFEPGQVIENASDIIDICVTMEHSYLGDLEMMLTCPNGTEIVMFNSYTGTGINGNFAGGFGGGGTFLGDPVDNTSGQPGIGWEYCFSDNAVWGTMGDEHPANTQPTTIEGGASMSPGTYQPEQSYDDLIGCPINGTWTLTIRDNIGADDGYIFEWGVLFNPDIDPNTEFYTPSLTDLMWESDPTIINSIGDTIIQVQPNQLGNTGYTLVATDNFGCVYDTTLNINVLEPATVSGPSETCISSQTVLNSTNSRDGGYWTYTGNGDITFSPDSASTDPEVSASGEGTFEFFFFDLFCQTSDSVEVLFADVPEVAIVGDTTRICENQDLVLNGSSTSSILDNFSWSPSGSDAESVTINSQNLNSFSYADPTDSTQAVVTLSASNFCGSSSADYPFEILECEVIAPSIINPNSNVEENSYFNISALELHPGNTVMIFDRWGRKVYEAENYHQSPWNGDGASDGVFYYVLTRPGYEPNTGYFHLVSKK